MRQFIIRSFARAASRAAADNTPSVDLDTLRAIFNDYRRRRTTSAGAPFRRPADESAGTAPMTFFSGSPPPQQRCRATRSAGGRDMRATQRSLLAHGSPPRAGHGCRRFDAAAELHRTAADNAMPRRVRRGFSGDTALGLALDADAPITAYDGAAAPASRERQMALLSMPPQRRTSAQVDADISRDDDSAHAGYCRVDVEAFARYELCISSRFHFTRGHY